jgi:hypothetical protein
MHHHVPHHEAPGLTVAKLHCEPSLRYLEDRAAPPEMLGPAARDTKPLTRLPHVAGVPVSKGGPEFGISMSYPVPVSTVGLEFHCRHAAALVMQCPALSRKLNNFLDLCKPAKIQLAELDTARIFARGNTRLSPLLRVCKIRHSLHRIYFIFIVALSMFGLTGIG